MSRLHVTTARTTSTLARVIHSRLEEVDGICSEVKDFLVNHGLTALCFSIDLLAREFVNNAVLHGNGGDPGKKVAVTLKIARKWISLTVADEGAGFRWRTMRGKIADETDTNGRGLLIGALYTDRMKFNRCGNQVTLWLKRYKEE